MGYAAPRLTHPTKEKADAVARIEPSEIRERSKSFNAPPGFHCVQSGLRRRKKKKEAERRETDRSVLRAADRFTRTCATHLLRTRQRAQRRSALASRRSTAALAAANERRRSTPATRFLGLRRHQVLPASGLVPVQRGVPRSTGRNAGRAYPPEPPERCGDEPLRAGAVPLRRPRHRPAFLASRMFAVMPTATAMSKYS